MANFLAKLGIDYKSLGSSLIDEAKEAERKRMQDAAVSEVTLLMQKIRVVESEMERNKESLSIYNGRLKAIQAGEFSIKFGSQYSPQFANQVSGAEIVYEDEKLNIQR